MRANAIVLLMSVLSLGAWAQESAPPPLEWGALSIDPAALRAWGTRTYRYTASEPGHREVGITGTVTLATEVSPDGVILKDAYRITWQGRPMRLEIEQTCRRDLFLTPVRIACDGEGDDEIKRFTATVAHGKAVLRMADGSERTREAPAGLITAAAMFRLVTLVPRKPGTVITFPYWLEAEEWNLKRAYSVTVMEPESIVIDGRARVCARIQLTGGGISPVDYWVSEDAVLRRVVLDRRKVLDLVE